MPILADAQGTLRARSPNSRRGRCAFGREGLLAQTALALLKPGPRERSGLFVSKARLCTERCPGFFVFVPRWRKRNTRVSQKHVDPGSNPGWGTRIFLRGPMAFAALLQLGCGKEAPPRVQQADRPRGGAAGLRSRTAGIAQQERARRRRRRGASSSLAACSIVPVVQGSGPRPFKPRMPVQVRPGTPTNSSRCSAAGQRASFGTTRAQVRILPARPGYSPVAQRNRERAATNPNCTRFGPRVRIPPGVPDVPHSFSCGGP